MNKVDRYKILIRYVVSRGMATNQKDLGAKLGYNNESAFSQVINCKVAEPKNFSAKLKMLLPELNESWLQTGEGEMLNTSSPCRDEAATMERVLAELTAQRDTLLAMLAEKDRQISQLLAMLNDKN